MCGICGVIQVTGRPRPVIDEERLLAMTDVMTHRGPNDRGTFLEDGIALGVRRLSIMDVEHGHQPFANEAEEVWAVQNGELYNHVELRKWLEGHGYSFHTGCDTEILPSLYEHCAMDFPTKLRGMFAVALWDGRLRRAVLVRDRLGVKPLYYALCGDVVVFASELKSILASGLVDPVLDYEAIDAYLTFGFVPAPKTPLAGVSKLMPGYTLVVDEGRVETNTYWRYPEPRPVAGRSPEEVREGLLSKLDESVSLRLMSDVPLGAMLSGGLDSSLIVGLMARAMGEPVKTFSVGFVEARDQNELDDARVIAELFGTDHHELELSYTDESVDLEDLVWHMDEPLADLSAVGFLALCELASQHVTVALSGQGADELFGGYAKHRAAAIVAGWQRLPGGVRRLGTQLAPHAPTRFARAARTLTAADAVDRLLSMSGQLDGELRTGLLTGLLESTDGSTSRDAVRVRLGGVADQPLAATLHIDGQLALVDDMLHYFDRASMAHSLEVRVPFLDHEFVEFCAGIPPDLKVRRLRTKHILKEAARGILPERIIDKRKIGFFHGSVDGWFQAQAARAIEDYLLQPEPRYAEMIDPDVVRGLVERRTAGAGARNGQLLLAILMLEIWLSTYLPRGLSVRVQPPERVAVV